MSAPSKLTITLSQKEKDDIGNWVAKYRAHPELIGTTREGGGSDWQTRIVLDEQTRARFEEIAAQFSADVVTPPVDGPGDLGRFDAAPSDWAAWAFITDAERTAVEKRYPDLKVQIVNLVQFYAGGSAGGLFIPKRRDASGYWYGKLNPNSPDGVDWTLDQGGAADAYINARCEAEGIPKPGRIR